MVRLWYDFGRTLVPGWLGRDRQVINVYDFWSCEELGAVVVQCGRRAIMLKGWVMLNFSLNNDS